MSYADMLKKDGVAAMRARSMKKLYALWLMREKERTAERERRENARAKDSQ